MNDSTFPGDHQAPEHPDDEHPATGGVRDPDPEPEDAQRAMPSPDAGEPERDQQAGRGGFGDPAQDQT